MGASLSEIPIKVDRDNCCGCAGFVARVNTMMDVVSREMSIWRVYSVVVEGKNGSYVVRN